MKRYIVQTFGCQMNVHDSMRIEETLVGAGYEATEEAALADLIVFNTCSVREKAEHKLRSAVGLTRALKNARPGLVVAVAGCVAQQEGERLIKSLPLIDVLIGPDNIAELPALVQHIRAGGPPVTRTVFDMDAPTFLVAQPTHLKRAASEYVTVMKGCDERCTYCVVPYTRGPERYRVADDIVAEVASLVDAGVAEVTLLGQTVNSWYDPRLSLPPEESQFPELLRRIAREVPGLARLRYTSPHPRHLTPALIAAHAELEVLPAHVHMPVQSGSDRVLKRMLRRYTAADYLSRVDALKRARPGLTLSTDIIVGFPGETRADFEGTLSLVRDAGFVSVFGFKYSQRPHTPALKLEDDVSEEEKDVRLAELFTLSEAQQQAHLLTLVGRREKVLVEGPSRDGSTRFSGRSSRHEIVHVEAPAGHDPTGTIVEVEVVEAFKHSVLGRMEGAIPAPARPRRVFLKTAADTGADPC